jgi:hypothetical protein
LVFLLWLRRKLARTKTKNLIDQVLQKMEPVPFYIRQFLQIFSNRKTNLLLDTHLYLKLNPTKCSNNKRQIKFLWKEILCSLRIMRASGICYQESEWEKKVIIVFRRLLMEAQYKIIKVKILIIRRIVKANKWCQLLIKLKKKIQSKKNF